MLLGVVVFGAFLSKSYKSSLEFHSNTNKKLLLPERRVYGNPHTQSKSGLSKPYVGPARAKGYMGIALDKQKLMSPFSEILPHTKPATQAPIATAPSIVIK
jgi:hypothetical protein